MATDPRTIIDPNQDPGLSPQPNNTLTSNVADYDTRDKKTVIIDYTDPPLYGTPELQIFNDPGGSNGQIQFNKGNRFGGDNNLVWNAKIRTLSVLGNIRVSGEILGRLTTNITKLKITGGNIGDVLTTDGLGNISWTDINLNYGNTNVANYLPTYTGNLSGSNLTISNTAYIYNISSTGLTSLTTANVSGNLTANAIYTNNYFYANGAPFVTSSYANSNVANYLPTYTGNVSANYFIGNGSQLTGLDSPVVVSDTPPNNVPEGNIWFNSQAGRSYVKYNDQWVDSSPAVMDASALRTDQDDNLELPGSAIFLDGRVYQDAANGTTSQRWVNMLPGEGENREMLRAYRDGFSNGDEEDERGQLGLVYQSPTISGLYITSFNGNNENQWTFEGTGNLRFPDDTIQTTAYQPATLLDGGGANANYASNIPPGGINNPFDQELNIYDNVQFANINAGYFIGNGSMLTGIPSGNANTGDITFITNTIIGDGNLNLQPDNSVSSAYLDIYLTTGNAGPDIHIAGNGENVILGTDGFANVTVGVDGNVYIQASTGTPQTWRFGADGNLTLPNNTFAINYANGTQVSLGGSYSNADVANYLPTYTGNVGATYFNGNGSQLTGLPAPVVTQDITSTGAMSIMTYDGTIKYVNYATVEPSTGNITGNYFIGNGSALTSITGGNVSGQVGNSLISGTVYTNAQPNITSLGTLASLSITGNITSGNASLGNLVTANYFSGNGSLLTGLPASYANSNVATFLASFGSNTISTTGNVSAGNAILTGTSVTGVSSILAGPTFTPLANTMAGFVSNVNSYTQLTIQNKSTGADATTDFVATANNGTDTVNYLDMGIINSGYDNGTPTNSLGNIVYAADSYIYAQGNASATGQSGGNLAIGTTVASKTVKIFAGGVTSSNIVATFANTGLAVTGNVTATNFSGNISITGNVIGTSPNVTLVAGAYSTVFDNTGVATFPGNITTSGNFVGNGASLTGVAVRTTGTWTVATGTNTYSITVPINGAYQIWVRCNIPNGIIAYQATVHVTNTNVPVLGTQRAWNYTGGGSPILLTTMPTQIVGAEGTISTTVVVTTTANVFNFVFNNTSGSSQTVSWGYVTL